SSLEPFTLDGDRVKSGLQVIKVECAPFVCNGRDGFAERACRCYPSSDYHSAVRVLDNTFDSRSERIYSESWISSYRQNYQRTDRQRDACSRDSHDSPS